MPALSDPEPGPPGSRLFTWAELLIMWELGRSFERHRLLALEDEAAAAVAARDEQMRIRWAQHRAQLARKDRT